MVGIHPAKTKAKGVASDRSESIKAVAGLIAVVAGVVAVTIIAGAAISKDSQTASTIATACAGIIGSICGAYLGMKIGSDQSKGAAEAHREQAAKAEVYALHVPDTKAEQVRQEADQAARETRA